jgi:hypothetical protein
MLRILLALALAAQAAPLDKPPSKPVLNHDYSAGGGWKFYVSADKLTDEPFSIFSLSANEEISDELSHGKPTLVIRCSGDPAKPGFKDGKFVSPILLGLPDYHDKYSSGPEKAVAWRVDDKIYHSALEMADGDRILWLYERGMAVNIQAKDLRLQFSLGSRDVVVRFSPDGLDYQLAKSYCGPDITKTTP